ncbi:MAG TPA: cation-translocating P-type ATPase [Verrucomicrobiota bacterium]|nr:cation-translocating P-type ATPase [Verrucomicrobiota bacterium]HOA61154.1 cation-translocating P-type ATPase [Verrucomicrobiota bacterium]HOF47311.1 cation-translocating P-type ATPase [Verrucomicrobiota bacterium]HOG87251.1 cation-translocating P-type ATPase [Verrucomicrobiota bacterium]HOR69938.1 cation-translocating P-type ATPase [Verrucomicrobiota bacterium]
MDTDAIRTRSGFSITGMTCQGCARNATQAIQGVAGVANAVVDLTAARATVWWEPGRTADDKAVVAAVQRAGFGATALDAENVDVPGTSGDRASHGIEVWSPLAGWRFNVVVGGAVTLVLMVGEWVLGLGMTRWFQWLAFGLALPVQIACGSRFYRGAFNQLRVGKANMDMLVALGSTTAFVYSTWGLFAGAPTHLYFMEAVGILTLISLGHWLEAAATARASAALRSLIELAPPKARRLGPDGAESAVPVATLVIGDRILLAPGDRVPTDGEVIDGESALDESMLTGESMPVEKRAGAKVYAGTINGSGRLVARVTAIGEDTALANIIAVVQRAQNSRAMIQKLGDRVSAVFVPAVVLVAIATGLWWGLDYASAQETAGRVMAWLWAVTLPATPLAAAFIHAAAVLIVACPCAMGLATPAAIMAGANAAARRGLLIRDGAALEKSGRITAVLFDKTGTLTQGKVSVAAFADLRAGSGRDGTAQALAADLAEPSRHPLSVAIAAWGRIRPQARTVGLAKAPALENWREVRGCGVEARRDGAVVRLGSLRWLREGGVDVTPATRFIAEWTERGATVLGVAKGGALDGMMALTDTLKAGAEDVVAAIRSQGKEVYLVTGDQAATAAAIARQAGIDPTRVFAEVPPERKAEIVQRLQEQGQRVAFVGDGINDAPALEQADLGIAVSRASDVAREAADIILLRSDIEAIPEAMGLARATLRTIRQNLFWAFFYNAAAVPLAALGFLSPLVCAAAMGLSDVLVIGNALRLRRWRYRNWNP